MKTTKAQFSRFKKEFLRCVEVLGLKSWRVDFLHEYLDGAYGGISCDYVNAVATISMTTEILSCNKDKFVPETVAKHECIHLLLYPLVYEGRARYAVGEDIDTQWEHIVRVIEKIDF